MTQQTLHRLEVLFQNLQELHKFLKEDGHNIINDSGSLHAPKAHKNLKDLVAKLEDFLWIVNSTIAKYGGIPTLI